MIVTGFRPDVKVMSKCSKVCLFGTERNVWNTWVVHRRGLGKCLNEWWVHPDTQSSPESWYEVTRLPVRCKARYAEHRMRNTEHGTHRL